MLPMTFIETQYWYYYEKGTDEEKWDEKKQEEMLKKMKDIFTSKMENGPTTMKEMLKNAKKLHKAVNEASRGTGIDQAMQKVLKMAQRAQSKSSMKDVKDELKALSEYLKTVDSLRGTLLSTMELTQNMKDEVKETVTNLHGTTKDWPKEGQEVQKIQDEVKTLLENINEQLNK